MSRNITPAQYDRVVALLGTKCSIAETARLLGISERTVRNIRLGNVKRPAAREVSIYRCSLCGHLVTTKPCLECEINARVRRTAESLDPFEIP